MKHNRVQVLTFFAALMASVGAQAALSPLSFGLKGGYGLASNSETNSSGLDLTTHRYKSGLILGGSADIGLGPVGVFADVLWSKRTLTRVPTVEIALSRIEVPVLVHLSTGLLRVEGGLYYAKALGSGSLDAGLATSDFGLIGGVGFTLPLGLVTGLMELRYSYGVKNLISAPTSDESLKFQSLDLVAGIYF